MNERTLEEIIKNSMKMGTILTLKSLGLISEVVTRSEAEKTYSRRLIKEWRSKGWITGYPTGNSQRGTVYFKRSELEIASAMMQLNNAVPANKIFKDLSS